MRPILAEWLTGLAPVLDPMAGVGSSGVEGVIHGELEPEWAVQCPAPRLVADAGALPVRTGSVAAVVTSPTYGNRLADHHHAQDASVRHTYYHALGRRLHPRNTGQMQWGDAYRAAHRSIWAEVHRVLQPGGLLVVAISDHIRAGQLQPVVSCHLLVLLNLGFQLEREVLVDTPRLRHGRNAEARVAGEQLLGVRR